MCGIVGFSCFDENLLDKKTVLENMSITLEKRGPDEGGTFLNNHVALAHRRLTVVDLEGGKQPMKIRIGEYTYTIVYNGELYNTNDLKKELETLGYSFSSHSDTEVLLTSFIEWKEKCLEKLNGIFAFAIWNDKDNSLFIARDRLGVKPLFYSIKNNTFIFASEIKAILKHPYVPTCLDKQGICEIFGLGPAKTPGASIFKDVLELRPGHFLVFNKYGIKVNKYWSLVSKEHTDNFETTCEKVKFLVEDSIKRQLVSDVPLCTFLSGGLDSSIITAVTSDYYKKNNLGQLNTFSVDYVDNDKNFVKSDFQPNSDNYYIDIMQKKFNTIHHKIILDTPALADTLEDAMCARDLPGMADVDSSLLLFCKNTKKEMTVSLTGECADEIFGGYPWFYREDALNSGTFPWSIAIDERQNLLNSKIASKVNLKEYIDFRYNESLAEVEILSTDSKETAQKRKISHLTLNWFMQTLLDRSDRMAMYNGFELRVPFCDYRLAQYVWNIPWEMKSLNGREKGLLRYIYRDYLPKEIVDRKKSPYPKTHNPTYLAKVKEMLSNIMKDNNAPINTLLNRHYILDILETDGKAFTRPWFGQLMTGPQLMAYLCQVNMWLEKYEPQIEL